MSETNIGASVGGKGDSSDNAPVETMNGLYKAEVIHRKSSWKHLHEEEYATLK